MPNPLAVLDEEHALIERVLSVIEQETGRIDSGVAPDADLLRDAIWFFAEYADARHHGKEERCLFPMLAAKKEIIRDGPIKVLTGEHESGRYFTRELREGLLQLEQNDSAAVPRIRRALFLYSQLLRKHIAKEREIIFLLARVLLTEEETIELANRFRTADLARAGAPVSDYVALVERLENRSLKLTRGHKTRYGPSSHRKSWLSSQRSRRMTEKISVLIPVDGSTTAEQAFALVPALRTLGEVKVRVLSVAESDAETAVDVERLRERLAAEYLDDVASRLGEALGDDAEYIRRTGITRDEIIDESLRPDVDVLLMTAHGQSNRQSSKPGSVADRVIRGCSKPVLLLTSSSSPPANFSNVEVALDGSATATLALPLACEIAARGSGSLRIVTVVEKLVHNETDSTGNARGLAATFEGPAQRMLDDAKAAAGTAAPVETALLSGHPAQALLEDLEAQQPDLIVMSAHGKRGFTSWALGSVAERIIANSPVPVLLVRRIPSLPPETRFEEKLASLTRAG